EIVALLHITLLLENSIAESFVFRGLVEQQSPEPVLFQEIESILLRLSPEEHVPAIVAAFSVIWTQLAEMDNEMSPEELRALLQARQEQPVTWVELAQRLQGAELWYDLYTEEKDAPAA